MNVRFSGITHYRGSEEKISAKLAALRESDSLILTAGLKDEGVALDGDDAANFLKNKYNIELPAALKDNSDDKAVAAVRENPKKYGPIAQNRLKGAYSDVFFVNKIFNYYRTAKEKGYDAENHPVKEELV